MNVSLMNNNKTEPKHFGSFIWDLMKILSMMRNYLNAGISDET